MDNTIDVTNLTVTLRNKRILKNISFELKRGEYYCLVGQNGSGKSTLCRALMGIISPAEGKILVNPAIKKKDIGYLSSELSFYENLKIKKGIAFYRQLFKIPKADFTPIQEKLNLDNSKVKELSSGKRAMLMFSLILEQKPRLIIIDDILNKIDPLARNFIFKELITAITNYNTTVVTVNAFNDFALSGRLLFLQDGRLLLDESLDDLKSTIKKVVLRVDVPLADELPVYFSSAADTLCEYYIKPFSENYSAQYKELDFIDLNLSEIVNCMLNKEEHNAKKRN